MTKEEQAELTYQFLQKMHDLIIRKGDDYSNDDRLSVFRLTAEITGLSMEQVAYDKIVTKVLRIGNLLNKVSNFESLDDNLIDLANYCVLLSQIIKQNDTTRNQEKS